MSNIADGQQVFNYSTKPPGYFGNDGTVVVSTEVIVDRISPLVICD
jgi:hypothetical protein